MKFGSKDTYGDILTQLAIRLKVPKKKILLWQLYTYSTEHYGFEIVKEEWLDNQIGKNGVKRTKKATNRERLGETTFYFTIKDLKPKECLLEQFTTNEQAQRREEY